MRSFAFVLDFRCRGVYGEFIGALSPSERRGRMRERAAHLGSHGAQPCRGAWSESGENASQNNAGRGRFLRTGFLRLLVRIRRGVMPEGYFLNIE